MPGVRSKRGPVQDLRRAVLNSANADRACAHNSHCGSNRDSNQMSDCHDRLHPADDRRNQSANATGGKAEKLTNHVMGVTARPRVQPISERFRSGGMVKRASTGRRWLSDSFPPKPSIGGYL